jgi:hypothetical protein
LIELRGILTHSEILDHIDDDGFEEKLRDAVIRSRISMRTPDGSHMLRSGEDWDKRRDAAVCLRFANTRFNEDFANALKAAAAGNADAYEDAVAGAVVSGYMVDLGLDYLENLPEVAAMFPSLKSEHDRAAESDD